MSVPSSTRFEEIPTVARFLISQGLVRKHFIQVQQETPKQFSFSNFYVYFHHFTLIRKPSKESKTKFFRKYSSQQPSQINHKLSSTKHYENQIKIILEEQYARLINYNTTTFYSIEGDKKWC